MAAPATSLSPGALAADGYTTAAGGSFPSSTAITLSAHRLAIASRVVRVAEPMWGTSTVPGSSP